MEKKLGGGRMNALTSRLKTLIDERLLPFQGVLFVLCLVLGVFYLAFEANRLELDVNYVSVSGNLNPAQRNDALERLGEIVEKGTELALIKRKIESLSWVYRANVTRDWPDSLDVDVVPEVAVALWNDNAFINQDGSVFLSEFDLIPSQRTKLPQLYGPQGSELRVSNQYQQLNDALLNAGHSIDLLKLDERGGWSFKNQVGITVLLGKDELTQRVQRFLRVATYVTLKGRIDAVESIDTRYTNGVAIDWKESMESFEIAKTFNSEREQKL
ncbi:MAG: cell division protein FtsQ/DivIB [Pseudomonadales bacterium]|nr:cell division protein FtsQ/DivIB [Pseudomonadales bacterium]MDG1444379.1 cell division protein FtsQ/DivIB [Pseudomonadales bacterium]